ncbi:Transcription factor SKN7 [Penicillium subrubescens]|uniref:Transcription factor n=1 Tax=Penicillium subrubescens TaxID=1316194 RepID=A0A1Q5UFP9_9EURO|nr:Transcription factor SKN7 [Penicillium subrubescens]KAJ5905216.1 Transcription factor SKN7 [Penicillium subrubescens]OKP11301.1 Transcription factor prr1 [Penicillium subrubescens]
MEGGQTSSNPAPAGNSSDFVRKLYKMLEDPSYASIVRWGDEGDSFVVLECEKFTKTILPKHFKHSNFASFVRQLNKYDFHKVRQNNEENGQSPYGQNAWEFKHPEFRANSKDSLDNIRRKAPAPRKQTQTNDEAAPTQQIDLLNQQIVAQQQQIQHLSDRYAQLTVDHQLMLQEVMRVQKTVLNHENVIHQVMTYLLSVDARQRRDSKALSFQGQGVSPSQVGAVDDEPSSPLQQASKLLNDMNSEMQFNLAAVDPTANDPTKAAAVPVAAPPMDPTTRNGVAIARPVTTAPPNPAAMVYPKMGGDLEQVVYPVGATNGIDPMYSDHVNNVPYPMPAKPEVDPAEARRYQDNGNRKKTTHVDPGWVRSPQILLVEDDATCRQIGGKFLYSFNCVVDTAFDGLEAVNKMQGGSKYDLILMDIIMPNLDGVSACHLIRQFDRTPIIAMTSNIRSDDIQLYFQHGMDDVLPKPFTRKSLLGMLEKHLVHLKTMAQGIEAAPPTAVAVTMAAQTSATQSIKEDNSSPGQSPAGSMNNWQSPGQFHGMAPVPQPITAVPGQYVAAPGAPPGAYTVDQNGVQFPAPPPVTVPSSGAPPRPQHRRQMSEMASATENPNVKRQRMYPQPQPMMAVQAGRPG